MCKHKMRCFMAALALALVFAEARTAHAGGPVIEVIRVLAPFVSDAADFSKTTGRHRLLVEQLPSVGFEGGFLTVITLLGSAEVGYLPRERWPQIRAGGLFGVAMFTAGFSVTTTLAPRRPFETVGWVVAVPLPISTVQTAPDLYVEPFGRGDYTVGAGPPGLDRSFYQVGLRFGVSFGHFN